MRSVADTFNVSVGFVHHVVDLHSRCRRAKEKGWFKMMRACGLSTWSSTCKNLTFHVCMIGNWPRLVGE